MPQVVYFLVLGCQVGDTSARFSALEVTINFVRAEHRFVMLGDDVRIRNSRNLARREYYSVSGGARVSTGDRSCEHESQDS